MVILADTKKNINLKEKLSLTKGKILISLLVGFAVPFMLLISSSLSVYFSNAQELSFGIKDYMPAYLVMSAAMFVAISLVLLLTTKWLHNLILTLCAGGVICAYIQTIATTISFRGLPGDGTATPAGKTQMLINLVVWFVLMALFVFFGVIFKRAELCRKGIIFLLILSMVMQLVSIIPSAINFATADSDINNEQYYLSTENLLELSSKENVVVIVLDNFDRDFYLELVKDNPDALKDFDGFTYYDDNIATYPRTFPAITSMISGVNTDFSMGRTEYFESAYTSTPLFTDLKNSNYKINIFTPSFHSYDNAAVFCDTAENVTLATGNKVTSQQGLIKRMLLLSSYFWLPDFMKSETISANSFNEVVMQEGDTPKYSMDNSNDVRMYDTLVNEGLTTQSEKNTFTFLHLRGCHTPLAMDENCSLADESTLTQLQQTKGCFKLLGEYIKQMKDLGIYDNATIIITGDHGALGNDDVHSDPSLTALLVKEKGEFGTPIKTSTAQVSQANLHATIIKSAGITTNNDYGTAYSDVAKNETVERTHYFQVYTGSDRKDENVTYKINGTGTDFGNWEITNREEIGYIYN